MNINIFGFEIKKKKKEEEIQTVVGPTAQDGSSIVSSSAAYYSQVIDMDATLRSEHEMIRKYREVSLHPECDSAIEEIVNEVISVDDNGNTAELNLEDIKLSDSIKKKFQEEFEEIKYLINFDENAHDLFRSWYIDGRQYFIVTLDTENPKKGIQKIDKVDSRKIKKIKKIEKRKDPKTGVDVIVNVEEFFIYNEKGIFNTTHQGIKLSLDSVVYAHSGLYNENMNMVLSYLHKAVKPVNQLKMLEDATVIYRISRAPERRIFYIDVGNLPKAKADQYVTDIMNKFKNKIVYDACLDMNTVIPLLDGRKLTLYELQEEFETGKQNWVYSCDPTTGKFAPGLITSAGITKFNQEVVRITLDNGKSVTCTYDHKFPVWGKGKVEAKDLVVGDSMIPHYTRQRGINKSTKSPYEQIFDNKDKKWKFTHRLISSWKDENNLINEMVNSIGFPNSLVDFFNKVDVKNKSAKDVVCLINNNEEILNDWIQLNNQKCIKGWKKDRKFKHSDLTKLCYFLGYNNWTGYKDAVSFNNHKITKIEFLTEKMDVGTLGIDKNEIYHDYHTFALDVGIYTCNSTGEIKDDRKHMSMLEDYWLPRREGGKGTEITTLPGGQNLSQIEDVNYFQQKVYQSLNVPISRLQPQQNFTLGRSNEITRDEIKFHKFKNRLANKYSQILIDMLKIQLIAKNIVGADDWDDIERNICINFIEDNSFVELKETELLMNRVQTVQQMESFIGRFFSEQWIKTNVLKFTEEEIKQMDKEIAQMPKEDDGMGDEGNVETTPPPPPEPPKREKEYDADEKNKNNK